MNHSRLARAAGNDSSPVDLEQAKRQFQDLQRQVVQLYDVIAPRPQAAPEADGEATAEPISYAAIRRIIRARRARTQYFDSCLFGDPAWDMLLELYGAHRAQQRLSVSGACSASAVPPTTALRWIRTLEHEGMIRRHDDPLDGRRTFIELSGKGIEVMAAYFADPAHHYVI